MTDLTKITTPFGLLDEATQEALRECGGPWEVFYDDGWNVTYQPGWFYNLAYRQRPQRREWWAVGKHLHDTRAEAEAFLKKISEENRALDFGNVIHVREVLP